MTRPPPTPCQRCRADNAELRARVAELEANLPSPTFVVKGEPFTSCSVRASEVLKAVYAIPYRTLASCNPLGDFADVCKAELARRAAEERG